MPTRTQGIVVLEPGAQWKIQEITLSDLADDEILVEMVASGICYTDIKTAQGKFPAQPPIVLGHEGVGYVKDCNKSGSLLSNGDAVVLSYASCSTCQCCRAGHPSTCDNIGSMNFGGRRRKPSMQSQDTSASPPTHGENDSFVTLASDGRHLNGGFFGQSSFSRLAIVHVSSAVKVDVQDREELKKMVLGCAFQTGAGSVLNVCQPAVGSTIAIWGCGGVGLSAIMAAKLTSPSLLLAIDMSESKLSLASKYGATHTLHAQDLSSDAVRQHILDLTSGRGVQYALDAAGSPAILELGQTCLAPRGTLVTIGGTGMQSASLKPTLALQKGLVYKGAHQGDSVPALDIPKLLDLWRKGSYPFDEILSFYAFEDFEKALEDLKSGKAIKPVLVF